MTLNAWVTRRALGIGLGASLLTPLAFGVAMAQPQAMRKAPLIVAHRGASGYRPEHTLEAYDLAISQGADYIEPDLVATRDGVLVCRHEPMLSGTTDVAQRPEFADRKRTIDFEGTEITDYFASDFTLAELQSLRAVQAFPERDQSFNGQFKIPTLSQVIALAQARAKETGRSIGIYPEIKHPALHRETGLPLEEALTDMLTQFGWNDKGAPVFIQSFEADSLKRLRPMTPLPLVQLVDGGEVDLSTGTVGDVIPYDWRLSGRNDPYAAMLTPQGLKEVATYADVIAPWKRYFLKTIARAPVNADTHDSDCDIVVDYAMIDAIKASGLKFHTWTLRNEPRRLAAPYDGDPLKEFEHLFELGIDGVFTDFPDTGVTARKAWLEA